MRWIRVGDSILDWAIRFLSVSLYVFRLSQRVVMLFSDTTTADRYQYEFVEHTEANADPGVGVIDKEGFQVGRWWRRKRIGEVRLHVVFDLEASRALGLW